MASKSQPVTQRRLKIDQNGDMGTPECDDGRKVAGCAARVSVSSQSSRGSVNSCPQVKPKTAFRKDSPLTGSSNGLNSKPVGLNSKPPVPNVNVIKKFPGPPIRIAGHNNLKASKSAPLSDSGLGFKTKYFVSDEQINGEYQNHNGAVASSNGCYGEIAADMSSLHQDQDDKTVHNDNVSPGHVQGDIIGTNGITPNPISGPLKNFLGRERHVKAKSVPMGLGLCSEDFHPKPNSKDEPFVASPLGNPTPTLCSPSCHGLHFCLQRIGTLLIPMPNNKPMMTTINGASSPTVTHNPNALTLDDCGAGGGSAPMITGTRMNKIDVSFQEAFSNLNIIRNVAYESGICSLEDHQHIAAIETLLLKIFSQNGSSKMSSSK